FRETSDIIIDAAEPGSVRVNVPGSPVSMVALNTLSSVEILLEELCHLVADKAYSNTLRGLRSVEYYISLYRSVFCFPACSTAQACERTLALGMVTINRVANLEELVSSAALKFIVVVAEAQTLNGGVHGDGIARVVLTGGGAGIG